MTKLQMFTTLNHFRSFVIMIMEAGHDKYFENDTEFLKSALDTYMEFGNGYNFENAETLFLQSRPRGGPKRKN